MQHSHTSILQSNQNGYQPPALLLHTLLDILFIFSFLPFSTHLHSHECQYLQQMVLDDVANDTCRVEEPPPALSAEILFEGDLVG